MKKRMTSVIVTARLVGPPAPVGAMSLNIIANSVQLTRSSTIVAVMIRVPISPFKRPRSISTRAMTGFAEFARFMPMKRANERKWFWTDGPQYAQAARRQLRRR